MVERNDSHEDAWATQEAGPRVLLCVTGGIAVYKAVEVLRLLQKAGCEARVACTEDALRFVGAATWEGLVHHRVATSLYDWPESAIPHVELAGWADAVLVMPATANMLAKMATGLADEIVSTTLLAVPAATPVVVAPAMNVHMWLAAATQHNVGVLRERGVRLVMPVSGHLACDDVGEGKLAPAQTIADAVLAALPSGRAAAASGTAADQPAFAAAHEPAHTAEAVREPAAHARAEGAASPLAGRTLVVTAGPTHEAIDPVRYIANASSGKMGYAIAREAARRGARVILVSGPVALACPEGVARTDVTSAVQMHDACVGAFMQADAAVCAAAVADYTPARPADHKLKKDSERLDRIELVPTTDILAELGRRKSEGGRRRIVVGFAAETDDLMANAARKLERKGADIIVANDVSRADSGFGSETNRVCLLSAGGIEELPTMPKADVAAHILDAVERLMDEADKIHEAGTRG